MIRSSNTSTWQNMGRRAFTNPSKIESQRERARNRRLRQQQRQQKLVRQECSAYSGVRVVNSTHDLVSPEDVSCNGPRPVGNPISLPTRQVVASAPTSAMTIFGGAIPPVCLNEQSLSHSTACYTPDARAAPSLSSQLTGTGHGAEQVAAHIDAPPTRRFSPIRQAAFPETRSPRGCTPESTRALTRLRVQKYRNRLHRLRIPPILPPRESDFLDTMINCRCQSTAGISGSSVSMCRFRANPQTCPVCSCVGSSQRFSGPINPAVGRNHETLGSFIEALRRQDGELSPDFLESHETAYDQAFQIFFNSRCHCTSCHVFEVNE